MNYIETQITFNPVTNENCEILFAILGEIEYESFSENENGVLAYIKESLYNELNLQETLETVECLLEDLKWESKKIEDQNWNAEWEKNFDPIFIDDICLIRAPFHNIEKKYPYEIIIEPKMSFGTGHHATTASMIKLMSEIDFSQKSVLDMGCGTGVLAIYAEKKGATDTLAIDIDSWSYENTIENIERNNCKCIKPLLGDASLLNEQKFDIILANINRNILLNDIPAYLNCLNPKGSILLSGFYTEDIPVIQEKVESFGLKYEKHITNNNWVAVLFNSK